MGGAMRFPGIFALLFLGVLFGLGIVPAVLFGVFFYAVR